MLNFSDLKVTIYKTFDFEFQLNFNHQNYLLIFRKLINRLYFEF